MTYTQLDHEVLVDDLKKMFMKTFTVMTPVLCLMVAMPAIGTWTLYFSITSPLPSSMNPTWITVLLLSVLISAAVAPFTAARYKQFLKYNGAWCIFTGQLLSAVYMLVFGIIFADLVRRLVQTDTMYAVFPAGFFSYCIVLVGWFSKLPFDVAVKLHEETPTRKLWPWQKDKAASSC